MKVAVIGTGYVGLTQAACLADRNNVVGIDHDTSKIEKLREGEMPVFERGLESRVKANLSEGRLKFTTDINTINGSEVVFICVGTPPKDDGKPDLSYVENVAQQIGDTLDHYAVIVEKSTVPVNTADWMKAILRDRLRTDFDVAVNPEFLREGTAVNDFYHPSRIVIGTDSPKADAVVSSLYRYLNAPILHTDMNSAELIKHGSNAALAMRISFTNMVSQLCEKTGADVENVMAGIGLDPRIGPDFLKAGLGYGGFCFPKDLEAFVSVLRDNHVDASLLESVASINRQQVNRFVDRMYDALGGLEGKTVAILGLAFKPGTDDMRLSQSIPVINKLYANGAKIRAYDPKAMDNAMNLPELKGKVEYFVHDPYDAITRSDAVALVTEWDEFRHLDLKRVRNQTRFFFDGRNVFDPERMKNLGFKYYSVGRRES
jgi:UDPglucose 6-dehydrogenase